MGWLDGALRIMPSWEWRGFGHTIPLEVFLPAVIFPGLIFNICMLWPLIERAITKDNESTTCSTGPATVPSARRPGRPCSPCSSPVLRASVHRRDGQLLPRLAQRVLWFFRFAVFVVPIIAYFVAFKICHEMRGAENIGKRKRALVVSRSAEGEYATTPTAPRPGDGHEELDPVPVPTKVELLPEPVGVTVGTTADGEGVRRVNR